MLLAGLSMLIAEKLLHLDNRGSIFFIIATLAISGLFGIGLAIYARTRKPQWLLEKRTGRELFARQSHSLYWIGTEYWGLAYLALAALLLRKVL